MLSKGVPMRKRLLALALLTTLACALAPSVTFADERGATPTPVTIEVGDDGAPVSTSGDGWTYDNGELVLEAGYAFAFTGHAFDVSGENRIWNSGIIVDGIFVSGSKGNGSAVHNEAGGVIQGGTFNMPVNNYGTIEGGTFHESAHNHGKIAGGTFDDYVTNSEGAVVSGGVFEDGGNNNSVDNSGTIGGGEFNIGVNNSGAIEGRGVFNAYVQNGNARFGTDKNKSCTISGGTFNSEEMDNFGTIEGGTFNGEILSRGIIAGGTFSSTSTVASNDEDTTDGGGTISGGTFAGPVTNGDPDPDWNAAAITGGTFAGAVTNYDTIGGGAFSSIVSNKEGGTVSSGMFLGDVTNRGVVEGGFFARPIIIGEGGTVSSCTFPVNASLAGLSLAGTGAEQPVATYEKDGEESNCLTLTADTGYTLPSSVSVRLGSADGRELVSGTDYTYNDATGVVAVKKGAVAGPLFLAASGVPAIAPAPEPTLPTPGSQPSSSSATLLAATGDSVQPTVVAGIVLLAAGTLAASAIACRKRRASRR